MEASDLDTEAESPLDNDGGHEFNRRPRGLSVGSASGGPQRKISTAVDIETGKLGGHREHVAEIRRQCDCVPRRRHIFQSLLPGSGKTSSDASPKKKWRNGKDIDEGLSLSIHGRLQVQTSSFRERGKLEEGTQYRLSAQKTQHGVMASALRMIGISAGQAGIYEDAGGANDEGCRCFGVSPNNMVTMYLHWTFRNSFMVVFFSAAVAFFTLTMTFALFIVGAGRLQPSCIYVNGQFFGGDGSEYADAFSLSWQTFSTAGYGMIYPSTSSIDGFNAHKCVGVTIICSLESFVGILFGSFCGAIVFGKVARVRSHAQVVFSDPIVVRYGTGVLMEGTDDASSTTTGKDNDGTKLTEPMYRNRFPCPILEFRIVNRLHSTLGGEIMDATMHLVASIDELQVSPSGPSAKGRRRKSKRRSTKNTKHRFGGFQSTIPESEPSTSSLGGLLNLSGHTHQAFDEDPSGKVVPRRIFSKLELETPDHPFFKRVWLARHNLDDRSPLLTNETRQQIRMNDGFWPESLNNFEAVRASIRFDQILVSLSGTSNADANSVYAQKVYEYVDMNIGYRFANMLYRDINDGSLRVDASIINDVVEQYGGGAEPLTVVDKGMREILVL